MYSDLKVKNLLENVLREVRKIRDTVVIKEGNKITFENADQLVDSIELIKRSVISIKDGNSEGFDCCEYKMKVEIEDLIKKTVEKEKLKETVDTLYNYFEQKLNEI